MLSGNRSSTSSYIPSFTQITCVPRRSQQVSGDGVTVASLDIFRVIELRHIRTMTLNWVIPTHSHTLAPITYTGSLSAK